MDKQRLLLNLAQAVDIGYRTRMQLVGTISEQGKDSEPAQQLWDKLNEHARTAHGLVNQLLGIG